MNKGGRGQKDHKIDRIVMPLFIHTQMAWKEEIRNPLLDPVLMAAVPTD
jgi:hypothetical protein